MVASAFYYNPALTFQYLESTNPPMTMTLFTGWFAEIDKFESYNSQHITVLGLASIVKMDLNTLPPVVRENMGMIVTKVYPLAQH